MTSAITTSIAVDPALVQNAAYRFNPADRQYIDDQIRGCQKQIVDCVASGVQCTWLDIDAASAAVSVGDLGCSAASATNSRTVKKVSAGTIGAAKSIHCMFLTAGAPGARVLCAVGGRIPRSITGLASIGGVAVANIVTGRADTKASLADDDYPIGSVDSGGNLSLVVGQPQFQVVFNGGGGFSVGIYVDVAGDDGTGTRGNASLPYQTIGAALATMHSGDVIFAGPGSFAGALVGPELAAVSIVGSGENETTITSADAAATIVFSPLVTKLQSLTIARCTVTNTGAGQAIFVGGDRLAALGVCVTGALVLDHVRTVGAVEVRCAGNVRGSDNQIIGEIILNEVDNADFFATTNNGDVHCRWQLAAVLPAGVGGAHRQRFIGCALGDLKPSDVTHVECWGGKCASVTATLTDDGAIEGTFKGDGELGAVSISSTSVAAVSSAVLDGAHMSSLTTASAGGAQRVAVSARGAHVDGTVTAGELCDIDIRGGVFNLLAAGGAGASKGTVNRSLHIEEFAAAVGDTPVGFTVPFPDNTYSVAFSMSGAGGDPFYSALSATGFTATCTAVLANCKAIVHHE